MPLENPRGAFNRAVTRFNGKNLFDLWSISCIFSCIEYFDSWEGRFNFLFPTIYAEKVALFHRAILQSSSVDYKRDLLAAKDVPYVFNSLNEATSERTFLLGLVVLLLCSMISPRFTKMKSKQSKGPSISISLRPSSNILAYLLRNF